METFTRHLEDQRNSWEKLLSNYIRSKNAKEIKKLLQKNGNDIDLSQKDERGYTSLEEAVLTQNKKVLLLLLNKKPSPPIDDALILASRLKYDNITDVLLEHLKNNTSMEESSEFDTDDDDVESDCYVVMSCSQELPSDTENKVESAKRFKRKKRSRTIIPNLSDIFAKKVVTKSKRSVSPNGFEITKMKFPLNDPKKVLFQACAMDDPKVIQLFLNKNVRLPTIKESLMMSTGDHLKDISEQLIIWKAITNPVYVGLTEKDPVLAAFKNNNELQLLSKRYPEHQDELRALAMKSEQFAVDLLSMCNTKEDVCNVLSLEYNANMPFAQIKYGRLLKALEHKQKKFISHPNCQTVVNSLWTENLSNWRKWSTLGTLFYIILHALSMPFVATATALGASCLPPGKIPLNRCIYSVTSYLIFLALLALYLTTDLPSNQFPQLLWCIAGFVISAMLRVFLIDLPMHGLAAFVDTFWNMYELVMYTIFLGAFTGIIWFHFIPVQQVLEISNSLLAVASILAFGRLFNWFHLHPKLGPFIIAFKTILFIVCRVLCIFTIIFLAFAFSLHFLYKGRFVADSTEEPYESAFGKLSSTFSALFWAMYGYGESNYSEIDTPSSNLTTHSEPTNHLTEVTGTFLWGLFHVACIIVLVNMLIAIMTGAFERIYEDCDTEWKFARTKMQMYYLEDCTAIPEPFNVIYFLRVFPTWIWRMIQKQCNKEKHSSLHDSSDGTNTDRHGQSVKVNMEQLTGQPNSAKNNSPATQAKAYMELIQHLITEYIKKKSLEKEEKIVTR